MTRSGGRSDPSCENEVVREPVSDAVPAREHVAVGRGLAERFVAVAGMCENVVSRVAHQRVVPVPAGEAVISVPAVHGDRKRQSL